MRTRAAGSAPSATAAGPGRAPAGPGDDDVPPRLRRALGSQRAWAGSGVHLVPIRHHSPACALALSALLEEVRPAVVLIEGPAEYTALLPALQDPDTVPPVAVLSLVDRTASYYPLAEFSPEWVALRWAGEHDAEAAFIDRAPGPHGGPLDDGAGGAAARTLQAEYHLARSTALDALARRLGCRDHDEVWEQLFEDRGSADIRAWPDFFADTLAWSALARLDAEREVLDADGTHAREAVMAAALRRRLKETADGGGGPLVVVTGAFHTPALLDALDAAPEAAWLPEPEARTRPAPGSWLIRYDYARLDSLGGYGAGMPSPGLWQRAWRARTGAGPGRSAARTPTGARGFATAVVLDVVTALRERGEPLGTAQVRAAVEQALGLAALRGRAWPGRTDILDALTSCLVKDDTGLSGNLGAAVAAVFAGSAPGRVPPGTAAPPLVAEVRERLTALRFTLDDALERRVSLDTARRPRHRRRRELLARLRFAGVGLARQVGGADLVAGTGLGQLVEEWAYAWTPQAEAALVRAAQEAPTLDLLVATRLAERLSGESSAGDLAEVLTELAVMGMGEAAAQVCDALETAVSDLSDLAELAGVLHRLVALVEGSGRLSLDGAGSTGSAGSAGSTAPRLRSMLGRGTATAARLVAELVGLKDDEAAKAVDALIAVRDLLVRLAGADSGTAPGFADAGREAVLREIDVLRRARAAAAVLVGCATGIASTTGSLSRQEVADAVVAHLSPGADPAALADFLVGLVRAAPDAVLRAPDTLRAVTRTLTDLDEPGFLAVLPDLRRAFTTLRPTETHRLAEQVAALAGADASQIDVVWNVDPAQAALGQQIERDLVASLVRDGLERWVGR